MNAKKMLIWVLVLSLLATTSFVVIKYYSIVFARDFVGEVIAIERVTQSSAIVNTAPNADLSPTQMFSFAVALKLKDGQMRSASSEDRQWAIVKTGQCVEARFFPYPFWDFEKSGTFHGARLLQMLPCEAKQ